MLQPILEMANIPTKTQLALVTSKLKTRLSGAYKARLDLQTPTLIAAS